MNRSPLVRLWPLSSRLRWFTTLSIIAGVAALAWATLALPLMPAIALGSAGITGRDPAAAGLLFWMVLGLGGSLRPASLGGHAVLTFHLPFIVAAMLLGGPVAGSWVAFVSTIELRELKEVPWYGTLANHAAQALGAVVGGIAAVAMRQAVATLVAPEAAALGAALAGALVFSLVVVAHTAITVALREELTIHEVALLFGAPWRRTILAEIILAWVLAFAYVGIGWWAAGVCAVLAVLVWEAQDDRDRVSRDDMTGLLNRRGLIARLDAAVARARRTGVSSLLVALDLDGFREVNNTYGHPAGDEVLQIVGERLVDAIRVTDVAARVGGDEFTLLLPGVTDAATAKRLADRIREHLAEPITLGDHEVRVGSSLGLAFIDGRASGSMHRLLAEADRAMYAAKHSGGGVRFGRGLRAPVRRSVDGRRAGDRGGGPARPGSATRRARQQPPVGARGRTRAADVETPVSATASGPGS